MTIIEEPGARTILQEGDRLIIRQGEEERARRFYRDVRRERRGDQEVLIAPRQGGVEIVTVLDTDGNLLRRIRREPDGTETVLIDNTRDTRERRWDWRNDRRSDRWEDRRDDRRDDRRADRRDDRQGDRLIGRVGSVFEFGLDVPPPVVSIPRDRYIVDYGDVYEEDDLEEVFLAPPVSEVRDRYTLDEVRYNPNLRDYMPRVDLDAVTFASGSWQLSRSQVDELSRVAEAMNSVIEANPEEIFLIEGHTDAVGRAVDNLSLSDRRAETVAYVLSEYYDVPPENLVTQGYGEEYLKIDTEARRAPQPPRHRPPHHAADGAGAAGVNLMMAAPRRPLANCCIHANFRHHRLQPVEAVSPEVQSEKRPASCGPFAVQASTLPLASPLRRPALQRQLLHPDDAGQCAAERHRRSREGPAEGVRDVLRRDGEIATAQRPGGSGAVAPQASQHDRAQRRDHQRTAELAEEAHRAGHRAELMHGHRVLDRDRAHRQKRAEPEADQREDHLHAPERQLGGEDAREPPCSPPPSRRRRAAGACNA